MKRKELYYSINRQKHLNICEQNCSTLFSNFSFYCQKVLFLFVYICILLFRNKTIDERFAAFHSSCVCLQRYPISHVRESEGDSAGGQKEMRKSRARKKGDGKHDKPRISKHRRESNDVHTNQCLVIRSYRHVDCTIACSAIELDVNLDVVKAQRYIWLENKLNRIHVSSLCTMLIWTESHIITLKVQSELCVCIMNLSVLEHQEFVVKIYDWNIRWRQFLSKIVSQLPT